MRPKNGNVEFLKMGYFKKSTAVFYFKQIIFDRAPFPYDWENPLLPILTKTHC